MPPSRINGVLTDRRETHGGVMALQLKLCVVLVIQAMSFILYLLNTFYLIFIHTEIDENDAKVDRSAADSLSLQGILCIM